MVNIVMVDFISTRRKGFHGNDKYLMRYQKLLSDEILFMSWPRNKKGIKSQLSCLDMRKTFIDERPPPLRIIIHAFKCFASLKKTKKTNYDLHCLKRDLRSKHKDPCLMSAFSLLPKHFELFKSRLQKPKEVCLSPHMKLRD